MFLRSISLLNFRSYKKREFKFESDTTLILGPNTSGKTNLMEAIYFLSLGKSFRAEKDIQVISYEKEFAKIVGEVEDTKLEIVLTHGMVSGKSTPLKRYLVNGVARRRLTFSGNLFSILFSPSDLELIISGPSLRRRFLDETLQQVDSSYRGSLIIYEKALRQRNALLLQARETGVRNQRLFEFFDELLVQHGSLITLKRKEFIEYINNSSKSIFPMKIIYDASIMSYERLSQYKEAEVASGNTLVGPQRDDFITYMGKGNEFPHEVKQFGSRGQQRLVVLQLKLLQLRYMEEKLGQKPLLLLDDIFSELDQNHIQLVLSLLSTSQTILTTTHPDFIPKKKLKDFFVIELGK